MNHYDAIIVGAGHNGLTAGVVLARSGLRVLVVERNRYVGGMAASQELWKGFTFNVGAWALLALPNEMIETLGLADHGLEIIKPRSSYVVFGAPEDPPFIFYASRLRMLHHLWTDHGPSAVRALAGFSRHTSVFAKVMKRGRLAPPEPMAAIIARAWGRRTREILELSVHGSAMDVVRRYFPDPSKHRTIQASLSAMSIDGTHGGPWTPGTATSMSYHYTVSGSADEFKMPRGGIGAVSGALLGAFEQQGGMLRRHVAVERLLLDGTTARGVVLDDGEEIRAPFVLSSLDANTTFSKLAHGVALPTDFSRAIDEIDYRNGYIQIHLALKEPPVYRGHLAFVNENDLRWLMAYIPSPEHLDRCWRQYRRDTVPDDPVAYCTIPSMVDPSLAPSGMHTCTIFSHYFPVGGTRAEHVANKKLMADRVIEAIHRHAPNFRPSIMKKAVLTHRWFGSRYGITGGDFCHGLVHPGQMWDRRPVPGWSSYRTPVDGLYLCGSGCHPGPGVTCMPGFNGAKAVLKDLRS